MNLLILNLFWEFSALLRASPRIQWGLISHIVVISQCCSLSLFGLLLQNTRDWVAYKHQKFILYNLEAGSPRSGCQHGRVLVKALFQVADCRRLLVSSRDEGARELSGAYFIKALILLTRAPPSWPHHLPKASPPNIITLGVKISACEFGAGGGDTIIQIRAVANCDLPKKKCSCNELIYFLLNNA